MRCSSSCKWFTIYLFNCHLIYLLHLYILVSDLYLTCLYCLPDVQVLPTSSSFIWRVFFIFLFFIYLLYIMSYNLRGNSVIASYRTFIHCGILSCKVSCEKNSLQCEVCLKHFHYKCIKITEREYDDIKSRNLTFVCGVECYNAIFPFFFT